MLRATLNNLRNYAKNFIEYRVHKDLFESPISQLTKETRFADLMIIGSETFYKSAIEYGTHEYLKDALHGTECPVIIVPEKFNFPSNIILAYDGSASSVFAIKQFALLFPELCNLKTNLVYAETRGSKYSDRYLLKNWQPGILKTLQFYRKTIDHKDH